MEQVTGGPDLPENRTGHKKPAAAGSRAGATLQSPPYRLNLTEPAAPFERSCAKPASPPTTSATSSNRAVNSQTNTRLRPAARAAPCGREGLIEKGRRVRAAIDDAHLAAQHIEE